MSRVNIIRAIEEFTQLNKLNHCQFAVSGEIANFLLNDIPLPQYPTIEIALAVSVKQTSFLIPEMSYSFNLIHHHGKWATYTHIPESNKFVVSTYDRQKRKS